MTRHTLRPRLLGGLALAGLFLVAAGRAAEDEPGFTKLFNGKDLAGWKRFEQPPRDKSQFTVEDEKAIAKPPTVDFGTKK